jgi:cytochrome P450
MLLLAQDEDGTGGFSDRELRDEMMTLFLAGHETTSLALSWTWYLLSQNPAVEAKLHAELDRVLGGRVPALADLHNLPYTDQVIKESMRLYPPVYLVARTSAVDMRVGDYTVPARSSVLISPYITHRDPRWWPDPETFRPERFEPGWEESLPKYAYFPFGGGPRVCIGNSFAQMEARLLLATLAGRYTLRLSPGQRVEPEPLVTLRVRDGLRMQITPRQPVKVSIPSLEVVPA